MKTAMLFPGYGSQFVGMAKELYDDSRLMQEYFEEASNCLPINFVKLCFASSEVELSKIENAYPSLFLVSSAIGNVLLQHDIKPTIVAGYQIGQYSAACAVGALTLPDGLYFLAKYAQFYQEFLANADVRSLVINGMSYDMIQQFCDDSGNRNEISITACHSTTSTIVSGLMAFIEKFEKKISAQRVSIAEGTIAFGLYCPLMEPVLEQLRTYLEKIDFKDSAISLLSAVNGNVIWQKNDIKNELVEGIAKTLRWDRVVQALASYDIIIEVGPGTVLSKWVKAAYPEKNIVAVNKMADILILQKMIAENAT